MILMGQEFGESWGVGFRRTDFLRSRFISTYQYIGDKESSNLINYYGLLNKQRLNTNNRALISGNRYFLNTTSFKKSVELYAQTVT